MRIRNRPRSLSRFALTLLCGASFAETTQADALRIEGLVRVERQYASGGARTVPVSEPVALGMVAFNSPYILGGDALRANLTCNACHSTGGQSGAATNLSLTKPLPDLFHRQNASRGKAADIDYIARFIRTALPGEFQSKDVPESIISDLSIYIGTWQEQQTSTDETLLHVGPWAMVQLGATLARRAICQSKPDEAELLIETARFHLGVINEQALVPESGIRENALMLNARLHAADTHLLNDDVLLAYEDLAAVERELEKINPEDLTISLMPDNRQGLSESKSLVGAACKFSS